MAKFHPKFDSWMSQGSLEFPDGWYYLVSSLLEELWEIHEPEDPHWQTFKIVQVKEKFAGLRFYIDGTYPAGSPAIIVKYEELSQKVCQRCSFPGTMRSGGWMSTLCDQCNLEFAGVTNGYRLGVIGSRKFPDQSLVVSYLERFKLKQPRLAVVSGGAAGPDSWATEYAIANGVPYAVYTPEWKPNGVYDPTAGFKRNTRIICRSKAILAFWDGESTGTVDSIKKALEQGKQALIIGPDGQSIPIERILSL